MRQGLLQLCRPETHTLLERGGHVVRFENDGSKAANESGVSLISGVSIEMEIDSRCQELHMRLDRAGKAK